MGKVDVTHGNRCCFLPFIITALTKLNPVTMMFPTQSHAIFLRFYDRTRLQLRSGNPYSPLILFSDPRTHTPQSNAEYTVELSSPTVLSQWCHLVFGSCSEKLHQSDSKSLLRTTHLFMLHKDEVVFFKSQELPCNNEHTASLITTLTHSDVRNPG